MSGDIFMGVGLLSITIVTMIVAIYTYEDEKKWFNNGICKKCKTKFTYNGWVDDGYREYQCNKCHTIISISWWGVDRKFLKENKKKHKEA